MGDSGQLSWPLIVRHLSNDKKQVVRTLDTVFVDSQSGVLQWYFTNKSGSVSRKKDNSTTTESVLDRFSRFSLSNPCNTEGVIGVLVDLPVGSRKLMKRNDLETFLSSGMDELRRSGAFLQVYLRPLRGFDVLFSCESNRMDEMKYDHEVIVVHQSHNTTTTAPSGKHEVTEDMHNQITAFSDAIIACLRDNHGLVVDQMTIECIVDDNQQAWLSSISQCETSSLSEVLNESEEEVGETISPSQHGGADADQRSHEGAHQHQQTTLQNQGSPNKQGTTGMTKAAMKKDIAERKKAKKELKTGDSGFKRNPVDMPPSIELMAKFAAEKERSVTSHICWFVHSCNTISLFVVLMIKAREASLGRGAVRWSRARQRAQEERKVQGQGSEAQPQRERRIRGRRQLPPLAQPQPRRDVHAGPREPHRPGRAAPGGATKARLRRRGGQVDCPAAATGAADEHERGKLGPTRRAAATRLRGVQFRPARHAHGLGTLPRHHPEHASGHEWL
jgi:hypothetical protein